MTPPTLNAQIMQVLVARMDELHISYDTVAYRTGVSEMSVRRWIKGHSLPSLIQVERFARAVGLEIRFEARPSTPASRDQETP